MSIGRFENEFEAGLPGLRVYDARPQTVEQIRARCLSALEAQRDSSLRRSCQAIWRRWIEPAAAFALSAAYLAAAIGSSIALFR